MIIYLPLSQRQKAEFVSSKLDARAIIAYNLQALLIIAYYIYIYRRARPNHAVYDKFYSIPKFSRTSPRIRLFFYNLFQFCKKGHDDYCWSRLVFTKIFDLFFFYFLYMGAYHFNAEIESLSKGQQVRKDRVIFNSFSINKPVIIYNAIPSSRVILIMNLCSLKN